MAATMVIDPGVDGWEIVNIDDFRETRTDHGDTPSFIGYPDDTPSQEFLDGVAVALGASGWMTTKEIGKDILGDKIKALYTVTGKPDFWDIRDETDFDGNPMYVEYYGEMGNPSNSVEIDVEADGDKIKDGKGYGYTIYEYRITTPLASAYSDDWDIEQALGEAEDWCRDNARIYDFEEEFDDYDDLFASKGDTPCAHANVFSKKSTDLGEGNSMHTSHDHVQGGLPDPSGRTAADSDRFEFWDDDEYTGYYGVPGDLDQSISWNIEDTYDSKWEVGYTVPNGWEFKVIGCTDTYEQARELLGTFLDENAEALLDGSYTAARKGKRTTANEDDYFFWGQRDFNESDPEFQDGLLAEFYYGLPDRKDASYHIKVRKTDNLYGRVVDVYRPLEDGPQDEPEKTYPLGEFDSYLDTPSAVSNRMVGYLDDLLGLGYDEDEEEDGDDYAFGSKAASDDVQYDDDGYPIEEFTPADPDQFKYWGVLENNFGGPPESSGWYGIENDARHSFMWAIETEDNGIWEVKYMTREESNRVDGFYEDTPYFEYSYDEARELLDKFVERNGAGLINDPYYTPETVYLASVSEDDGDGDDTSKDTDKTASSDDYEFWDEYLPGGPIEDPEEVSRRVINYGVIDDVDLSVTIETYGAMDTGLYTEVRNVLGEIIGTFTTYSWDNIDQDFLESPVYNDVVSFLDASRGVTQAFFRSPKTAQPDSEYVCHSLDTIDGDPTRGYFYYGPDDEKAWSCYVYFNNDGQDDGQVVMKAIDLSGMDIGDEVPTESAYTAIQDFENSSLIQVLSDYLDKELPEEGWPEVAMAGKHARRSPKVAQPNSDYVVYDVCDYDARLGVEGSFLYGPKDKDKSYSCEVVIERVHQGEGVELIGKVKGICFTDVIATFTTDSMEDAVSDFENSPACQVASDNIDGVISMFENNPFKDSWDELLQRRRTSKVRKSSRTAKRKMTMKEKLALINEEKLEDEPFLGML